MWRKASSFRLFAWIVASALPVVTLGAVTAFSGQTGLQSSPENANKAHAKLFNRYGTTKTISQLVSEGTGDVVIKTYHHGGLLGEPADPPPYPPFRLVALACTSDAAVVGTVAGATSGIAENDRFLFTNVSFDVEEIIKDNVKASIAPSMKIIVTRPGGKLQINGRTVRAIDSNFREFKPGERYLLFLKFIPGTGGYEGSAEASFQLLADRVARVTATSQFPNLEAEDPAALVMDTREAVQAALGCPGGDTK